MIWLLKTIVLLNLIFGQVCVNAFSRDEVFAKLDAVNGIIIDVHTEINTLMDEKFDEMVLYESIRSVDAMLSDSPTQTFVVGDKLRMDKMITAMDTIKIEVSKYFIEQIEEKLHSHFDKLNEVLDSLFQDQDMNETEIDNVLMEYKKDLVPKITDDSEVEAIVQEIVEKRFENIEEKMDEIMVEQIIQNVQKEE